VLAIMRAVQRWIFNRAGADMRGMDEETLALTVVETTMQEWLAAATLIRETPALLFAAAPSSHPTVTRPRPARPAARLAQRPAPAFVERQEVDATVGGARSIFWTGLALAVGVLVFL
jgi:hypothetical protein